VKEMTTAEDIYQKAKTLDQKTLQEIANFMDFLLSKQDLLEQEKRKYFPETKLEPPDAPPVHKGRALTIEEMDAAVADEAGRHKW
jgi:hypothetical protein